MKPPEWFDLVDLLICVFYAHNEHAFARWLPWYRRYLSALPWLVDALVIRNDDYPAGLVSALVAIAISWWNMTTSWKNRDNNRDMRKLEAAAGAELTAVQTAALQRQVVESR